MTYDFTIELSGVPMRFEDLRDRLHEAGCNDAVISQNYGVINLAFSREAEDMQTAIYSAQMQILSVVKFCTMKILANYDH